MDGNFSLHLCCCACASVRFATSIYSFCTYLSVYVRVSSSLASQHTHTHTRIRYRDDIRNMCVFKKKKKRKKCSHEAAKRQTNKWMVTASSENNGKMLKMNDRPGMLCATPPIAILLPERERQSRFCHAVVKNIHARRELNRRLARVKNDCNRKQCVCWLLGAVCVYARRANENVCRARVSDITQNFQSTNIVFFFAVVVVDDVVMRRAFCCSK